MKTKIVVSALTAGMILCSAAAAFMPETAVPNAVMTVCAEEAGDFSYVLNSGSSTVTISKYLGSEENVEIPAAIGDYPVTAIGFKAFAQNSTLKSVTIPGTVKSIGESAFYECKALETLTLGEGIESIGNYAFMKCSSLKAVTIPDSVTKIGTEVFDSCSSLETASIGKGVQVIANSAFDNCKNLTEVTLLNTVTEIGDFAFRFCEKIGEILIPGSVTQIGSGAFSGIKDLTIAGYEKTRAQSYAEENKIPFRSLGYQPGDLNMDGTVNLKDAVLLRRYIAGGWDVTLDETLANVNGDKQVNLKDVVVLRRYIAGGWNIAF